MTSSTAEYYFVFRIPSSTTKIPFHRLDESNTEENSRVCETKDHSSKSVRKRVDLVTPREKKVIRDDLMSILLPFSHSIS